MYYPYVVVGAGLAGLTVAERIAAGKGEKVLVVEKRPHIGGNVYDSYNEDGILVHNYGPHIFHTNDKEVYEYLGGFTKWNDFWHLNPGGREPDPDADHTRNSEPPVQYGYDTGRDGKIHCRACCTYQGDSNQP